MNFKEWLIDLFKDERGSTSVKPVIAILGAVILFSMLVFDTITTKPVTVSESILYAVVTITAIGMGADSLDKFSMKGKPNIPDSPKKDDEK